MRILYRADARRGHQAERADAATARQQPQFPAWEIYLSTSVSSAWRRRRRAEAALGLHGIGGAEFTVHRHPIPHLRVRTGADVGAAPSRGVAVPECSGPARRRASLRRA